MAYTYNGSGYRAGAAGVQSDLELRDYYAKLAAQSLAENAGRPTQEMINRARGDLGGALAGYQGMAANGMYSDADEAGILSSRVQAVNNQARAAQQNVNAMAAQRGVGANAGINAALGLTGQFAAAGQRGQARADLASEEAQFKAAGLQGLAGVSSEMAKYAATPTAQNLAGSYGDLYNNWRNAQVGYDGAAWGGTPAQPGYYGNPVSIGGGGFGTALTPFTGVQGGGTSYGAGMATPVFGQQNKKKKNYVY